MTSTLIVDYLGRGTHAARPATPPIPSGGTAIYYETDTTNTFVWNGGAWLQMNGGGSNAFAKWTSTPANPGWDPLYHDQVSGAAITLSNSNKTATPASGANFNFAFGTPAKYTGKFYFEFNLASVSSAAVGLASGEGRAPGYGVGLNTFGKQQPGQLGWQPNGDVAVNPLGAVVILTTIQTYAAGDTLGIAVDIDNDLVWFRTNAGNWNNNGSANPATGTLGLSLAPVYARSSSPLIWPGANLAAAANQLHMLSADFAQTPPSGFSQWGV